MDAVLALHGQVSWRYRWPSATPILRQSDTEFWRPKLYGPGTWAWPWADPLQWYEAEADVWSVGRLLLYQRLIVSVLFWLRGQFFPDCCWFYVRRLLPNKINFHAIELVFLKTIKLRSCLSVSYKDTQPLLFTTSKAYPHKFKWRNYIVFIPTSPSSIYIIFLEWGLVVKPKKGPKGLKYF